MGLMAIWWLLGLAVLVVLIWFVVGAAGSPRLRRDDDSPEAILKRRYARGEFDRDEYERKLTDIRK
ncbi:MAG TPA: SHOCT domain-containing protein [Vicinamibacterales bacterium]|nr:SHOCT domain-containing protein [Vicinamibacterales bacterium]